jgi:hypothetical protein
MAAVDCADVIGGAHVCAGGVIDAIDAATDAATDAAGSGVADAVLACLLFSAASCTLSCRARVCDEPAKSPSSLLSSSLDEW